MAALLDRDGATSGQLHRDLGRGNAAERRDFEILIDGLARAGLVEKRADSFVKGDRTIRFHRVFLTGSGRLARPDAVDEVQLVSPPPAGDAKPRRRTHKKRISPPPTELDDHDEGLFQALRDWRLREAQRRRVPAFRILTDRTLIALCRARPIDEDELLEVPGIGPTVVRKYGRALVELIRG
jgi:DNA topoisomerase-3